MTDQVDKGGKQEESKKAEPPHANENERDLQAQQSVSSDDPATQARDTLSEQTRLHVLPQRNLATFTALRLQAEADQAQGVSRAKEYNLGLANGKDLQGAIYTKSQGSYFKTAAGETYRLDFAENGSITLKPKNNQGEIQSCTKIERLSVSLGQLQEDKGTRDMSGIKDTRLPPVEEEVKKLEQEVQPDLPLIANAVDHGFSQAQVLDEDETDDQSVTQVENKEKNDQEDNRRRKYVVKEKDTIESIASKQCREIKLAALIYKINEATLQPLLILNVDPPQLNLRKGMILWLPSPLEIREFRAMPSSDAPFPFHTNEDTLEDEQLFHVVRLGETLKSIAAKHPNLQDTDLWETLARLNNLPVAIDQKDSSIKLVRGMRLKLPSPEQVTKFKSERQPKVSIPPAKAIAINDAGASLLRAGGFFPAPRKETPPPEEKDE